MKRALVACEESQAVTIELRKIGLEAYSCDLVECSGGHPEWHIVGDAVEVAYNQHWDMMIAHPHAQVLLMREEDGFTTLQKAGQWFQCGKSFSKVSSFTQS